MANVFDAILGQLKNGIKSTYQPFEDLAHGDIKGAVKNAAHIPGNDNRANTELMHSMGIRGKLGEEPWMAVPAIFGGIYAAGAAGAGGAGTTAGSTAAGAGGGVAGGGALSGAGGGATAGGTAGTTAGTAGGAAGGSSSIWSNPQTYMALMNSGGMGGGQQQQQQQTQQPMYDPSIRQAPFNPSLSTAWMTRSDIDPQILAYLNQLQGKTYG